MRIRLKILLSLIILSTVSPSWAKTRPICSRLIYILPQSHVDEMTSTDDDEIVESQLLIGHYLLKNRKLPVFAEGLDQELHLEEIEASPRFEQQRRAYRAAFPKGLPSSVKSMSVEQKEKIVDYGGVYSTLLLIGKLSFVGPTVTDKERDNRLFQAYKQWRLGNPGQSGVNDPYWSKIILDERERDALTNISSYFSRHPKVSEAILVFGGLHDFKRHHDLFPSQCIRVIKSVGPRTK